MTRRLPIAIKFSGISSLVLLLIATILIFIPSEQEIIEEKDKAHEVKIIKNCI